MRAMLLLLETSAADPCWFIFLNCLVRTQIQSSCGVISGKLINNKIGPWNCEYDFSHCRNCQWAWCPSVKPHIRWENIGHTMGLGQSDDDTRRNWPNQDRHCDISATHPRIFRIKKICVPLVSRWQQFRRQLYNLSFHLDPMLTYPEALERIPAWNLWRQKTYRNYCIFPGLSVRTVP